VRCTLTTQVYAKRYENINITLSVLLISHIRSKDAKLFYIIFLAELRQDIL